MNKAGRFLQSAGDFPMIVSLGRKIPAWGLSRWASSGLRFFPPDDEGFTLRGDKRRLVYKGRRRSHRFTILGDTAFEYDCILEREPESNVISLPMDGAEQFDFFRQPDFIKDPSLAGSYAVYKKETLLGEGTGKLCHIHRPEIIDSRGRRCWGDLSVTGNKLCITIPENWLSEAKYPVIVDPTVGTTTVGSQTKIYNAYMGVEHNLIFHYQIPVNRFLAPENIHGACTAYAYIHSSRTSTYDRPVMYSDDTGKPLAKLTGDEGVIDFKGTAGQPPGWRSAPFSCDSPVEAGANCWFGLFTEYWQTAYDYGGTLCAEVFGTSYYDLETIPGLYPQDNLASSLYGNMLSMLSELRLSMYFTYTAAQNHVRTLTQGVTLTDSLKQTGDYKRSATQTVRGTTVLTGHGGFYRSIVQTVANNMSVKGSLGLIRKLVGAVAALYEMKAGAGFIRSVTDTVKNSSAMRGIVTFFRVLFGVAGSEDSTSSFITRMRVIQDTGTVGDEMGHTADYLRGLFVEAGSIAETKHRAEYHRKQQDTAYSEAVPLRHLFIFIRLLTGTYIRDYIIGRFLKSKEEIVIKSHVCRELILESTLH
jgi:hypothetical protein